MKYGFYYIIAAILIFHFNEIQASVIKKVEPDGTITFYNSVPKKKPASRASTNLSSKFDEIIERISSEEEIDVNLIKCIIKAESDFQPDAVSSAGAMGLMQLMKATADVYNVSDPFDPEENVKAGVKHFKYLLGELNNDIPLALAAYHAGLGVVKKRNAIPYIKSTMNYVNRVMTLYSGHGGRAASAVIESNPNQVDEQVDQIKHRPVKRRVDKDGDFIFSN